VARSSWPGAGEGGDPGMRDEGVSEKLGGIEDALHLPCTRCPDARGESPGSR
jgi:hypothetical protein